MLSPDNHLTDPADTFLDTAAIADRYGIGLTKAKEVVSTDGFPKSVVPGMVRIPLVALRTWEPKVSLADILADSPHPRRK